MRGADGTDEELAAAGGAAAAAQRLRLLLDALPAPDADLEAARARRPARVVRLERFDAERARHGGGSGAAAALPAHITAQRVVP